MKHHMLTLLVLTGLMPVYAAEHKHHADSGPAQIPPPEQRVLVEFPDATKHYFLHTMRQNLSDIHDIQRALADGNFERAAQIAEFNLGMGGIKTHNALAVDMPDGMRNIGMKFHEASSLLAQTLQTKDMAKIQDGLANVTQVCVMCHAMYRVR